MEDCYFNMMLEMPLVPFRMRPSRPLTDEQLERFSAQQDVLHVEREPDGELDVRLVGGMFDPERETVEVYRPGREVEVLEAGSVIEGEGPVAGFVLELGKVWG